MGTGFGIWTGPKSRLVKTKCSHRGPHIFRHGLQGKEKLLEPAAASGCSLERMGLPMSSP